LPVNANVVSSSLIFVTLMMEAICSSEISIVTIATRRNILLQILHSINRLASVAET
jgi:hypothetical protein